LGEKQQIYDFLKGNALTNLTRMEIPDTDSALESDDVSLMSNESSTSSGSGTISRQRWIRQVLKKQIKIIYFFNLFALSLQRKINNIFSFQSIF